MKKAAYLLLIVLTVFGLSCQKTKEQINDATEFDINYSTQVSIPSSSVSVTAPAEFSTPEISTQSQSRFAAENTAKDLIDEIKMTRLTFTNPSGNLDFLKSVSIYIQAASLGDVLVATKSNIPAGSSTVAADLTDTNIKEYISKDKVKFRVSVTVNTGISSDQTLKIESTVRVKGKKIS